MRPPKEFSRRLPAKWVYWIVVLGLAVSVVGGLLGQMETGLPAKLNHLFLDGYLHRSANGRAAENTVVIDIDDVSLAAGGQWPWPRYRMAALIQKISEAQPAAIGLDLLFSEPDRTSLQNIQKSFKQDFGLDLSFTGASSGMTNNDGYFGQVLAGANVVGARYFYFDHITAVQTATSPAFHFTGKTQLLALHEAPGVLDNTHEISSQLKYTGFLNNQPDPDGMLRRTPLLIRHNGVIYPQLALATYMRAIGVNSARIDSDAHGPLIKVGGHSIPVTAGGFALLRFNGRPALYPAISAVDILNGMVQPAALKGKIVFVGASAAALNDLHSTIFDPQSPGLKTHAALIETIVSNRSARVPSWSGVAILLMTVVTGLLVSALFIFLREPWQLFLGAAMLALAHLGISLGLFWSAGLFLSPAAPMVVTGLLLLFFTTARFAIEKNQSHLWYQKLANAQQVTMASMAAVAETRDPETGAHIKRTQHYVKSIAERLSQMGVYTDILTPEYIDLLFVSAPLHDIGKVGVPDNILLKPGPLDVAEFELMKKHAEYGKNIIYSTAKKIEGDNFLIIAGEIALTHHEKWDGTGYPQGLAGQDIPLSGRIMAVADVYDALISRRCYKPPFPHARAMSMMREERSKLFDPAVLDAFFSIEDKILAIAASYQDAHETVTGVR